MTCALGTGGVKSMPSRREPAMVSGGRSPSPVTRAPMRERGSMIRRMGRRRSDPSPVMTLVNGWPASAPESSLRVVPELPASSGTAGRANPRRPRPSMVTTRQAAAPSGAAGPSTRTPRARRQARVEAQSAPGA